MVCDFKRANPQITPRQILKSQWLYQMGGMMTIKNLFGSLDNLVILADEALSLSVGTPTD